MRSRVMPGSLVTMARRVPVKRLKSVDLPTLGRPRMTRDGRVVVMKLSGGAVLHCNVSRRATKAAKARTRRRDLVAEKYKGRVSERGVPPGSLYEYQNKGLTEFAFRKWLILKDAFSIACTNWERYGKKEKTTAELPHSKDKLAYNFGSLQRREEAGKRKAAKGRCSLTAFFPEEIVHNIGDYNQGKVRKSLETIGSHRKKRG